GGVIYNNGNNFSVVNCSFVNNSVNNSGGVIYNTGINFSVVNCSFINSLAVNGSGGVIYSSTYNFIVKDSEFVNNSANGDGGVIYNSANNFSVVNCSFVNNSVNGSGGVIYNKWGPNFKVSNSSFVNNSAQNGGAICNNVSVSTNYGSYANFTVIGSDFIKNTANFGGAIYNYQGDNFVVNYNRFVNNTNVIYDLIKREIWEYGYVTYYFHGNFNYNWWGSNSAPSALNISNYFVVKVVSVSGATDKFKYSFVLNNGVSANNNLLPEFGAVINVDGVYTTFDARTSQQFSLVDLSSKFMIDNQIISVSSIIAKMYLGSSFSSPKFGSTVKLTAKLTDASGKAVSGKTIKFHNGNNYIGSVKTDSKGIATFYYKVPRTGILSIKATFNENNGYSSSSSNVTLNVPKLAQISIKNSQSVKGKIVNMKTVVTNKGPDNSPFVIKIKLPKQLNYKKPKTTNGIIASFNKKTRTVILIVNSLGKGKSLNINFSLKSKKGKFYVKPLVDKNTNLTVLSNNKLTIKVK
ncbi:MAG: Ig-like domain repeat protein, partial [Methanobacteriaceae archaeon]